MNPRLWVLLTGVALGVIAFLGGGAIKRIRLEVVPLWARIICGAGSLIILAFGLVQPRQPGPFRIHRDDGPYTSPDDIRVAALEASVDYRPPPRVGDHITVSFELTNEGSTSVTIAETFVAARDPGKTNRDFGHANEGKLLFPRHRLQIQGTRILSEAGTWQVWPCYDLDIGGQEKYCPDYWQRFIVKVVK
jgi:hypothetical protein